MKKLIMAFAIAGVATSAFAAKVAGVDIKDTASVDGTELVLNGAGLRKKYIIADVYVAALYLPRKTSDAAAVIDAQEPRRVTLVMRRKLSADTFMGAFHEGVEKNLSADELAALQPKLEELDSLFREVGSVEEGDELNLDFAADGSTRIVFEDRKLDAVQGADLSSALLKIWLGEHPVQADLKEAMLKG